MPSATLPFHNRIALAFDFDATLAPSSFDTLVESLGFEPERFGEERIRPLAEQGWDILLAQAFAVIDAAAEAGRPLTREHLAEVGRSIEPYDGVPQLFERVRSRARELVEDVEVEFHIVTAGWVDIHRETGIAGEFRRIYGSEFHYHDDGRVAFAKQICPYPEKRRYLRALSKGLPPHGPNGPSDVSRAVPPHEQHVPLEQMIYLGDGSSDMPVFELLNTRGGVALGVFQAEVPEDWGGQEQMHAGRRVDNLARADYSEGSELLESVLLAVQSIGNRIALRRLGRGE